MRVEFQGGVPHPRLAERQKAGPPTRGRLSTVGVNGLIALTLTTVVGTMWCAYAFAVLALLVLPQAHRWRAARPRPVDQPDVHPARDAVGQ